MDLLVEKDDKRTYLSRYKVITTSFEESSPSVKRNNTQIQYRNGNVDFGGWNEEKTIDYVGYYRADDLEDEEYLRERIYALLSDPEGYYITQLKNDNDDSFERPGETSGDYFDKQVNRPSHKRFYVYASSLESELVGSYGGHVLYKISATFTTMKLPYGESVPRDLDVKLNVPYVGTNILTNTGDLSANWIGIPLTSTTTEYDGHPSMVFPSSTQQLASQKLASGTLQNSTQYTISFWSKADDAGDKAHTELWGSISGTDFVLTTNWVHYTAVVTSCSDANTNTSHSSCYFWNLTGNKGNVYIALPKLELGTTATPWSPSPSDHEYNTWYLDTYYNTDNLVIPYSGTVPCNQLEQGFTVEFTAKESGSNLKLSLNGIDFIAPGNVSSGDVFKLSGYEYLRNGISIVKATNKAYFKLLPGIANKIYSSIAGEIRILNFQNLYA